MSDRVRWFAFVVGNVALVLVGVFALAGNAQAAGPAGGALIGAAFANIVREHTNRRRRG